MSYGAYQEQQFQQKLQGALERVRVVLAANKVPSFAADVHHQYLDKYLLAESSTNVALASQVNCLVELGITAEQLKQLIGWSQSSAVSLKFSVQETCSFDREETTDVELPTKHVLEVGGRAALTSKTVTTVTEYFWQVTVKYELTAIRGAAQEKMQLLSRTGKDVIKGGCKSVPPRSPDSQDFEQNVSWFLQQLDAETSSPRFLIDRQHAKCHTPRRNPEVAAALAYFASFSTWASHVGQRLRSLFQIAPDHTVDLHSALSHEAILRPVLPLLQEQPAEGTEAAETTESAAAPCTVLACLPASTESGSSLLAAADTNLLLVEEMRALRERRTALEDILPGRAEAIATAKEALLTVLLQHSGEVCSQYAECLDYIEAMLRRQLVAAIGKEVTPAEFAEYMRFHNRKLFADPFAPVPFCFAVRRSASHSPEGTVSIEQTTAAGIPEPIVTLVAKSSRTQKMEFPLNASSSIKFGGDCYLHAWLAHQFSGESGAQLSLVSRAQQFSSMLVLVGRIASAKVFEPKYAAIVQNKDELTIPLDMSTIPTPKEFKDAIASLSPEQQQFAKAFRAMQLESTLFGVLVIQIKPQLEKVLNLADDSLTKEIKLTQDLMQLFIKYQIPTDLLSFDSSAAGAELLEPSPRERLDAVKGHVKAMQDMIEQAKKDEIEERKREAEFANPMARGESLENLTQPKMMPRMMMKSMAMPSRRMEAMACAAASSPVPPPLAAPSAPPPAAPSAPPPAAPSAPAPSPTATQTSTPQPKASQEDGSATLAPGARDFTQVPQEMDKKFEEFDRDSALRPTIIKPMDTWRKKSQKALLAAPTEAVLHSTEQKREKDAAFDLLDALTRSGALPIEHASLHVVVAATHCFDKTVTETVVQDNMNPIEKVERSTLIMATTVHQLPAASMIRDSQHARVSAASPMLFIQNA